MTVLALIFIAMLLLIPAGDHCLLGDDRLLAIGGLLGLYVAAKAVTLLILRRKTKRASSLFAASPSDLSKIIQNSRRCWMTSLM